MSSASNVQLKEYVDHLKTRAPIRKKIDDAKESKDYDAEWQGRQEMHDYWSKVPGLYSGLLKTYGGDKSRMHTDINAYQILNPGE